MKDKQRLTYILADDDELFRDYLLEQLGLFPDLECLEICEDALITLEKLQTHTPDLLILDVEMPNLSGIQLVKSIKNVPLVIFITSHPHFAVEAFELDAVDYLVKPFTLERLVRALNKVRELINLKKSVWNSASSLDLTNDSFFIKDKNAFIKIAYEDVLYIQSLGDFSYIILQNGEKKIVLSSLKSLEQQLPFHQFVRVSRTYLINKSKVSAIEGDLLYIGKIQLSIGKSYADSAVKSILGNQVIKRFT